MANDLPPSQRRRLERERTMGLDPADDAAKWIDANDAPPPEPKSKSSQKSKALHRWRQAQLRRPR
jgi:hypothetical protein